MPSLLRFLKKRRLAARGMSCGKSRLGSGDGHEREELEKSPFIRVGILMVAAALLFLGSTQYVPDSPCRTFLFALVVLVLTVVQLFLAGNRRMPANSRVSLSLGMILLEVGVSLFLGSFAGDASAVPGGGGTGSGSTWLFALMIPFALAPLTLSVLTGPATGLAAAVAAALFLWLFSGNGGGYLLLPGLAGGITAVLSTLRVRRRSRLLRAGLYSGLAVWATDVLAMRLSFRWDEPLATDWGRFGLESVIVVAAGILAAVLASGFLPLLEQVFRITTRMSWLELSDLNHPLLRRLSLEAPGTYHHSLAMANLAVACAEKVGADEALCRAGSYFHDVGKLVKPGYFTENIPRGENPHGSLTPTMSALIILSHVKEGVDLAVRHRLHGRIIEAIREHHGTSLVEYFYRRACRQEQDARAGAGLMNIRDGDIPKVSEESFRYPGPKPQSLETVILCLADSAESAVRSLERPAPQRIDDLVHDILRDRIEEGQFDDAPVTLRQLHEIAATLVSHLTSMHHVRVPYRRDGDDGGTRC
jgi:cyclic-di-AMP phosphodiesterase PgpH